MWLRVITLSISIKMKLTHIIGLLEISTAISHIALEAAIEAGVTADDLRKAGASEDYVQFYLNATEVWQKAKEAMAAK